MYTLLCLIFIILLLVLILVIVMFFRVPSFRKEGQELFIAIKDGLADRKLTPAEKERIKKEWKDVDWKAAIVELFKGSKPS